MSERDKTWLAWAIILAILIIAVLCFNGCSDLSQMDLALSGQTNPDTGETGATIGAKFYFDHTPKRLPNYSKDK